jgi:two-component system, NarL family, response regulator NreC
MGIRVLLADHQRIVREGLRSLLACRAEVEIVGEAADGEGAITAACQLRPDIVILEIAMPGLNGVEITRRIRSELPETKVVALCVQSDRRTVIEMLRAGASAFLAKECGFDELMEAVRAVKDGRPYLGVMAAGSLIDELMGHTAPADKTPAERSREHSRTLTAREIEVLRLLASGKRVKEIARILEISVKTVESHRQNMMDKLEIHSGIELTRYALREGLASI